MGTGTVGKVALGHHRHDPEGNLEVPCGVCGGWVRFMSSGEVHLKGLITVEVVDKESGEPKKVRVPTRKKVQGCERCQEAYTLLLLLGVREAALPAGGLDPAPLRARVEATRERAALTAQIAKLTAQLAKRGAR